MTRVPKDAARAARLYIPSSGRNQFYPAVVVRAREAGYEVHDWSEPSFRWETVDPDYQNRSVAQTSTRGATPPPANTSRACCSGRVHQRAEAALIALFGLHYSDGYKQMELPL